PLRPIPPERRPLVEPLDLARHSRPLAGEELGHRRAQPRVADEVHALGGLRVKAAEMLEIAAGTRLEAGEPARDRVLDRRVVADVEVEVTERAERSPVAAVQRVVLLHVERPGDDLACLPGDDEAEAVPQALARQGEEAALEVLPAPRRRDRPRPPGGAPPSPA